MRKRISPATAIAVIALFFAMTGAGFAAANHYLITSIRQIKPSVRRELRGQPRYRVAAVQSDTASLSPAMPFATVIASCPAGEVASGGGFAGTGAIVDQSAPAGSRWIVVAHLDPNFAEPTGAPPVPTYIRAYAVCAAP